MSARRLKHRGSALHIRIPACYTRSPSMFDARRHQKNSHCECLTLLTPATSVTRRNPQHMLGALLLVSLTQYDSWPQTGSGPSHPSASGAISRFAPSWSLHSAKIASACPRVLPEPGPAARQDHQVGRHTEVQACVLRLLHQSHTPYTGLLGCLPVDPMAS